MRDCIRLSLRFRFTEGANQRRERAGRASDAACCRGNGVVTVYGIVPVDWKLPPFRQGINLLIDTVYFIVTLLNTVIWQQEAPTVRTCSEYNWLKENRPSLQRLGLYSAPDLPLNWALSWCREFDFGVVCIPSSSSRGAKSLLTIPRNKFGNLFYIQDIVHKQHDTATRGEKKDAMRRVARGTLLLFCNEIAIQLTG